MSIVKSFAVGNGDMFYILHNTDNFTIIDCDICDDNAEEILSELRVASSTKTLTRFICTHPDEDHFGGIERLDDEIPISNFYTVRNAVSKAQNTPSFQRYCELRDGSSAYFLYKGCKRKWLNDRDDGRESSGISILWPDTSNEHFKAALDACKNGESPNNTSAVIRYTTGPVSFLWLGDLETDFMKAIADDINLQKTTVVFAAHHGRHSGRIPHSWLDKLDPQIIVIGEAPSRHLHYYTGYETITQNTAGDVLFEASDGQVHIYAQNPDGVNVTTFDEGPRSFAGYVGSIEAQIKYTP